MIQISAIRNRLEQCADAFFGLIYPNVCQLCHAERATHAEGYVCRSCAAPPDGLRWIEEPLCRTCGTPIDGEAFSPFECSECRESDHSFRSARAAARLTPLLQQVIHRFKYDNGSYFEPFLTGLLVEQAAPRLASASWDAIVPIPLHWSKRRLRGFNQAKSLAKALSRATGLPVRTDWLRRRLNTPTQTRLTRSQRAENVLRAFEFKGRTALQGERIVLVDDVLTTGATASACAKVLRQNGAGPVDVWTVARGTLQ